MKMSGYSVFLFLFFCLEPTVREQMNENNFRHYGNFFESTILRLHDHNYVQSSLAAIRDSLTAAFERHLTVDHFTCMDHHRCLFLLE